MNTLELLKSKWELVEPGANVFGGGVWNPTNDLNWAMQQIRETGKPAGDKSEFNREAVDMLKRFIPSLEPGDAGKLVKEIHVLTHRCVVELTAEFEAQGLSNRSATIKAREIAYKFQGEVID